MKKILLVLGSMICSVLLTTAAADTFENNIDRPGKDYKVLGNLRDASVCKTKCQQDNQCQAWTFVKAGTIQGPKSNCYLKHAIPEKRANNACISGIVQRSNHDRITTQELKTFIAANGRSIEFVKNSTILASYDCSAGNRENCLLMQIAQKVINNKHAKLYISVVRKSGGLAKKRVSFLKEQLAKYGLSPDFYHIQRVSKNDKDRAWLSKNKQIWIRIRSI